MGETESSLPAATGPLVLIVDDSDDNRELFAELLTMSGYRVAEARDGLEAIALASELVPALVLMDLTLPEIDGCEATRRIKADARSRGVAVIALTGHVDAEVAREATDAGCCGFLTKPCTADALLAALTKALARP